MSFAHWLRTQLQQLELLSDLCQDDFDDNQFSELADLMDEAQTRAAQAGRTGALSR